jgi:8-oxo-dGTP pyrophosphatase MutT (NUDIX family)
LNKKYLQKHLHLFCPKSDKDFSSHTRASVVVVLAIEKNQCFILFMKRKKNEKDPWSGHYSFPGGKVSSNEGFLEAAKRECLEEVGVNLYENELIGLTDDYHFSEKNNFVIRPFVFITQNKSILVNCSREVEESFWWPLFGEDGLFNKSIKEKRSFNTVVGEMERPCIVFEDHVIWGITLSIFNNLLTKWKGQELLGNLLSPYDHLP